MSRYASADSSDNKFLWLLRGAPVVACLLLAAALYLEAGQVHAFLVGATLGILIASVLVTFQIKSVRLKDTPQPSDVSRYPLS